MTAARTTKKPAAAKPTGKAATPKPAAQPKAKAEPKPEVVRVDLSARVEGVIQLGFSRPELTKLAGLDGTTCLWRTHRLEQPAAEKLTVVLDKIADGSIPKPERGARKGGISKAELQHANLTALDALAGVATAKSIADAKKIALAALEALGTPRKGDAQDAA